MTTKKVLFLPDTHYPYHSKSALALFKLVAKIYKPDILVCLGDLFDFYAVSEHSKDPRRKNLLVDELEGAGELLQELETIAPVCIFLAGNHENRLERYLWNRAPQLFGLVSIQSVLKLNNWVYIPYPNHYKLGNVYICHTPGAGGKYATHKADTLYQHNVVFGHTHNLGISYCGNVTGTTHVAANFGWLGSRKYIDYTTNIEKLRRYVLGFGTGTMFPNGDMSLAAVPIIKNRCVVDGEVISI